MSSNTEALLAGGNYFERMGITTDHLNFDRFSASMKAVPPGPQSNVNKALYATIAGLEAKLKNGGGAGGDGAAEIQRLMKEADYSIYLNIQRATNNILAVNTIGNYVAGKPVSLPYVLFGYNDLPSNFTSSLKNVMGVLNQACPGIQYTITSNNGTQIWTWTLPSSGRQDIVTISYGGYNTTYTNLVTNQSQNPGTFYCKYVNYAISDATNGSIQGSQSDIQLVSVSSGGAQFANELLPNSTKSSYEFLPDRWNVIFPGKAPHFDATLGAVDTIIACPATDVTNGIVFQVQWNMFCNHHETHKSKR